MNEFSTYEYVVAKKREGAYRYARTGLIFLYVCFVLAAFIIGATIRLFVPMLALLPLATWILVFLTWRYVVIDYEYSVTSGILTFSKIYNNRTRKTVTDIKVKSAAAIAPLGDKLHRSRLDAYAPAVIYNALSSEEAPDAYFMIYQDEKGQKCAFLFEATAQALKIFRFYNAPATVVRDVTY